MRHELKASVETVHWGFFDPALRPVLTIAPGDEVTLGSVSGGAPEAPTRPGLTLRPELAAIHAALAPAPGPHILTGPIAIAGAEPGDGLRIEILDVSLADDWGFNWIKPGKGALPDAFLAEDLAHFEIDRARGLIRAPWGGVLPARPFFGVIGVAPAQGRVTSVIPGVFGGNIDLKELRPGAVLHLPVLIPGAMLSIGDGHAAQGDGEVCLTAVETGLEGRFRIHLDKRAAPAAPFAQTPEHLITLGFAQDLDMAMRAALRAMIDQVMARTSLSAIDAYRLCSVAADLRITQVVNVKKGVHVMLPLAHLQS